MEGFLRISPVQIPKLSLVIVFLENVSKNPRHQVKGGLVFIAMAG